jgi:hypothetical protein
MRSQCVSCTYRGGERRSHTGIPPLTREEAHEVHKLTMEQIKAASDSFEEERKAAFKLHMDRKNRPYTAPGRFSYRLAPNSPGPDGRIIIEAHVHDDTGRLWKGTGKTMRHAYDAVFAQLEANAQKDPAVDRIFRVIDEPPMVNPYRKRGPTQGNLL